MYFVETFFAEVVTVTDVNIFEIGRANAVCSIEIRQYGLTIPRQ
jgi:hypothetical protein